MYYPYPFEKLERPGPTLSGRGLTQREQGLGNILSTTKKEEERRDGEREEEKIVQRISSFYHVLSRFKTKESRTANAFLSG